MSTKLRVAVTFCLLAAASTVHAWEYFPNAKILGIVQWQDNSPVYFEVAPGRYCWLPAAEKNMVALILSLYSSGRPADIHCGEAIDTFAGIPGYRLHRIISH